METKTDLEQGISAVQGALSMLREYYSNGEDASLLDTGSDGSDMQPSAPTSHAAASGAGAGIIAMLETIESDFSKNLAMEDMSEQTAQTEYDQMSQENRIMKAMKEQDVKYKSAEAKSLDKAITEDTSDLEGLHTEMGAVLQYSEQLNTMCIAKPDTY